MYTRKIRTKNNNKNSRVRGRLRQSRLLAVRESGEDADERGGAGDDGEIIIWRLSSDEFGPSLVD